MLRQTLSHILFLLNRKNNMFAVPKKGRVLTLPFFLHPYKCTFFCTPLYLEVDPNPPLRLAVALSS